MARESALWKRVKAGGLALSRAAHAVHFERIENDTGAGHPDVDCCLDGLTFKLELKMASRPKRESSKIIITTNKGTKNAQLIWHTKRTRAGSTTHWVLVQVGEAADAKLYLIPGRDYDYIFSPELELERLSWCSPEASIEEVLKIASEGWL